VTLSRDPSTMELALVVATGNGLFLPNRAEPVLRGRRVGSIAVDGETVWAVVDGGELHRVDLVGSTELAGTFGGGTATCVHVHNGTVMVGGDDARLWRLGDDGLAPVESFLAAPTRADWYTPWGGAPSVLSMASLEDDLYVSVHVGGILRSSDGGETWTDTIDLHVDVHEVVVDPAAGVVWAATGERALAESRDRGASWEFHADGLHASYALAVAVTNAGVLTGVSSGHAARDGAVVCFDGSRFESVTGLPHRFAGAVGPRQIAGGGDHAALVAPGGDGYVSADAGRSWDRVDQPEGGREIAVASLPGQ